jgi:isopenicillin N synthase-like dioxygenase
LDVSVRAATTEEIPVIDVGNLLSGKPGSAPALAAQIRQACIGTGFFYVSRHGMEPELKVLLESMREYFDTPEADKATASIDQYQRGFRGQGLDQEPGTLPDCKESFDVGVDLPLSHASVAAGVPMHGPNQWPSHFPGIRAPADNYFSACELLGRKLLAAIACSLGEAEDFFEAHCSEAMVQMRMFHYPPPPEEQIGAFGSSPHTDYGMITLLAQDPIGGLEVQTLSGEWVRAPYIDGTLVVNLGDMLSRWTNDVYHSTLHRVINRAAKDRYSVAMFYHLNADTLVTPLAACCGDNEPPKYKPIKYLSHLTSRFEEVLKAKF